MTVSLGACLTARAAEHTIEPQARIVDTNIHLFQWPFRRLPCDEPRQLVEKIRSLGISQAWAGSFEALLHRDVAGVNQRLAEACRQFPELVPIGTINLMLPGWERDLEQCVSLYHMPGVRLYPNYHGYPLDDAKVRVLLMQATSSGCFVQIAVSMEDQRTQHHLTQVPDVDLSPLPRLVNQVPGARIQLLNARLRAPAIELLSQTPGIFLDVARIEGTDGLASLIRSWPAHRVLFGTHAPFLIPEAGLIRIDESDLAPAELRQLLWENAEALWSKT